MKKIPNELVRNLACIAWQFLSNLSTLKSCKAAITSAKATLMSNKAARSLGERQLNDCLHGLLAFLSDDVLCDVIALCWHPCIPLDSDFAYM